MFNSYVSLPERYIYQSLLWLVKPTPKKNGSFSAQRCASSAKDAAVLSIHHTTAGVQPFGAIKMASWCRAGAEFTKAWLNEYP
jgi:hypothetical protein